MGNSVFFGEQYTDRTLIESILASHYIVDYGFIKSVNPDKTIDVTHAKQLKTLDGQSLKATVTKNVEVLTLCGGGFSFTFDYKKGDKVLLLGLKDYVPKVEDVTSATETTAYLHYSRETIKAIPLCVFSDKAKVQIKVENGKLTIGSGSGTGSGSGSGSGIGSGSGTGSGSGSGSGGSGGGSGGQGQGTRLSYSQAQSIANKVAINVFFINSLSFLKCNSL